MTEKKGGSVVFDMRTLLENYFFIFIIYYYSTKNIFYSFSFFTLFFKVFEEVFGEVFGEVFIDVDVVWGDSKLEVILW